MKFKLILIFVFFIVLISFVYATGTILCYQETANDSSVTATNPTIPDGGCGVYNGSYDTSNGTWEYTSQRKIEYAYDGNWTLQSAAEIDNSDCPSYMFINYTIPSSAIDSSLFKFSGHDIAATGMNISLTGVNFSNEKLQFRISVVDWACDGPAVNDDRVNVSIWNESSSKWKVLWASGALGSSIIREEAMWWNVSDITSLNLTFRDETTNTLIEGETFTVYLEKSDFSQTYSTAINPFNITGLDAELYTQLKVSSSNYPEKQYLNIDLRDGTRNSPVNFTVYLINSTDSTEKTFNIVDEALNPLEDVFVVFTRLINGTSTIIAEEESDFAGQCKLYLDENYEYTINFSKADYEDKEISLEPADDEYVITLISTVGLYNVSVYEGIRYSFSPSNTILNNDTHYNFTFTLNSTVWEVTNCTLRLKNGTVLLNETSNFTSDSCYIRMELNTIDMTTIVSEAIYELDSEYEFTVTQQYEVLYTYEGEFSLKNFLDDVTDFGMAGFDDFGRMMLALIVIFIITALAAREIGFENKETLIFLVMALVWLFSYVNWLYLDFAPIPTILGFDLKKYIIAILISLAGGAFVIKKFTD